MKSGKLPLIFGLVVVVLGASSAILVQSGSWPLSSGGGSVSSGARLFDGLGPDTDPVAVIDAFHKGEPLPAGVSYVESLGAISASMPGVVDPGTGEQLLVVRLTEETEDLVEARIYVDGQTVFTATRAGGSIVDRAQQGYSVATMTIWIPQSVAFDIELHWDEESGLTQVSSVSIPND